MAQQQELFNDPISVDKSNGTKVCIKCNQEKPVRVFAHFLDRGGERVCQKCRSFLSKVAHNLRKINPHPGKDSPCPICLRSNDLVLDHDHETSEFRGYICSRCNTALGFFEDNYTFITRAVEYLKRYNERKLNDA